MAFITGTRADREAELLDAFESKTRASLELLDAEAQRSHGRGFASVADAAAQHVLHGEAHPVLAVRLVEVEDRLRVVAHLSEPIPERLAACVRELRRGGAPHAG